MRPALLACTLLLTIIAPRPHTDAQAEAARTSTAQVEPKQVDTDHDGLPDVLENALLSRFSPKLFISAEDCSGQPALFEPDVRIPTVASDNGTIYGQAFPAKNHTGDIELHFYHLWRRDCGEMGHRLDAEHVSVLLRRNASQGSGNVSQDSADWKALYWYAAAHEDTVCDASQITRAQTLNAEAEGAHVWISAGKHASFLTEALCTHGCGGDRCTHMLALHTAQVINLGELNAPMNGAIWMSSSEWPLTDKLSRSDFPDARIARLDRLPETDVAWANPGKRPAQAAILGANAGIGGAAKGARAADTAMIVTDANTSSALGKTADNTGGALSSTYRGVRNALRKSARKTANFLTGAPK
jgi:hypothetical protein